MVRWSGATRHCGRRARLKWSFDGDGGKSLPDDNLRLFHGQRGGEADTGPGGAERGGMAMVVGAENLGASIKRTPPRERPLLIDSVQRGNLYGMDR